MRSTLLVLTALGILTSSLHAERNSDSPSEVQAVVLPQDGDDFSRLVAQAATHDAMTDFYALRFAWLNSAARKRRSEQAMIPDERKLLQAAAAHDDAKMRTLAIDILSANYSNIAGQAFLSQACENLHDQDCAKQAHFMADGLIQSLTKTGDGKTCATGMEVATVAEEYDLLRITGLAPLQQALIADKDSGHKCDALTVIGKNGRATLYFLIDKVLADEIQQFGLTKKP